MTTYHKIQTVFKRNPETNHRTLLENDYSVPEFEFLAQNEWLFTEKVDGTNIRVIFDGQDIRFGGRTDNAQIPAPLMERLQDRFLDKIDLFKRDFGNGVVLYGEGYGAKIQKVGGNYRPDQDFVLFDVKMHDAWPEYIVFHPSDLEAMEKMALEAGKRLIRLTEYKPDTDENFGLEFRQPDTPIRWSSRRK